MVKNKTGVYISVVAAMIMWSLTFVWFKIVNEYYGPFTIVFLRLFLSTVILLGVSWFSSVLQKIRQVDMLRFLVLAFIYPFIYLIAESLGLTMISASQGAVIISIIPRIVPVGEACANPALAADRDLHSIVESRQIESFLRAQRMTDAADPLGIDVRL